MNLVFPHQKKIRVIISSDVKNEADDQFAVVHALLTPSFELHGIIPAHFGIKKSQTSMEDSYEETIKLLDLMNMRAEVRVEKGAQHCLENEFTPVDSPGARMIIEEALKNDDRPLHIAFLGPLTEMASALLLEPALQNCKIRVVWIGGGAYPLGGKEFNLFNDIHAANVVFKSRLEVWHIPKDVYKTMPVSYSELLEKVYDRGEIGRYLVEQLIEHNARRGQASEDHNLGDSPAIGVMLYPGCGKWAWVPAPEIDDYMYYRHTGKHRPIKVYQSVDSRFILEDFYAKVSRFAKRM